MWCASILPRRAAFPVRSAGAVARRCPTRREAGARSSSPPAPFVTIPVCRRQQIRAGARARNGFRIPAPCRRRIRKPVATCPCDACACLLLAMIVVSSSPPSSSAAAASWAANFRRRLLAVGGFLRAFGAVFFPGMKIVSSHGSICSNDAACRADRLHRADRLDPVDPRGPGSPREPASPRAPGLPCRPLFAPFSDGTGLAVGAGFAARAFGAGPAGIAVQPGFAGFAGPSARSLRSLRPRPSR